MHSNRRSYAPKLREEIERTLKAESRLSATPPTIKRTARDNNMDKLMDEISKVDHERQSLIHQLASLRDEATEELEEMVASKARAAPKHVHHSNVPLSPPCSPPRDLRWSPQTNRVSDQISRVVKAESYTPSREPSASVEPLSPPMSRLSHPTHTRTTSRSPQNSSVRRRSPSPVSRTQGRVPTNESVDVRVRQEMDRMRDREVERNEWEEERRILLSKVLSLEEENRTLSTRCETLQAMTESSNMRADSAVQELREVQRNLELQATSSDAQRAHALEIQSLMEKVKNENERMNQQVHHLEGDKKDLQRALDDFELEKTSLSRQLNECSDTYETRLHHLQDTNAALLSDLEAARRKCSEYKGELEEKENELRSFRKELNEESEGRHEAEREMRRCKSEQERVERDVKRQLEMSENERGLAVEASKQLREDVKRLQVEWEKQTKEQGKTKEEMLNEVQRVRDELQLATETIKSRDAQLEVVREEASRSEAKLKGELEDVSNALHATKAAMIRFEDENMKLGERIDQAKFYEGLVEALSMDTQGEKAQLLQVLTLSMNKDPVEDLHAVNQSDVDIRKELRCALRRRREMEFLVRKLNATHSAIADQLDQCKDANKCMTEEMARSSDEKRELRKMLLHVETTRDSMSAELNAVKAENSALIEQMERMTSKLKGEKVQLADELKSYMSELRKADRENRGLKLWRESCPVCQLLLT